MKLNLKKEKIQYYKDHLHLSLYDLEIYLHKFVFQGTAKKTDNQPDQIKAHQGSRSQGYKHQAPDFQPYKIKNLKLILHKKKRKYI